MMKRPLPVRRMLRLFPWCAILLFFCSSFEVWCQPPLRGPIPFNTCDFCLASQGISPLEVGSSGARIDVRYLSLGTMYRDGSRTDNTERELETHFTQQFSIFYAPLESLSFAVLVPVPRRRSERVTDEGVRVTGNQFGAGDVTLLTRFKPLVEHSVETTYILSFVAGVKMPTGKTDGRDSQGDLLDAHVQLGTGSTDILAGVSGFAAVGRFAFILNLLAGCTGEGANDHQFGNSLNYDATARFRLWPEEYESPQYFLTLGFVGDLRAREMQDGVVDPNSGGNVAYLSPGVQVFITPALAFEFQYQTAIIHRLYGEQLGEDYRLMSGLQFLF